jgi:hypothetical protein
VHRAKSKELDLGLSSGRRLSRAALRASGLRQLLSFYTPLQPAFLSQNAQWHSQKPIKPCAGFFNLFAGHNTATPACFTLGKADTAGVKPKAMGYHPAESGRGKQNEEINKTTIILLSLVYSVVLKYFGYLVILNN